jgi:hypothetical protein
MDENTISVSNCPTCGHFPTQFIAEGEGTVHRALPERRRDDRLYIKLSHTLEPLPDDAPNSDVGAIHLLQNNMIVAAINVGDRTWPHEEGEQAAAELEHCGVKGWQMGDDKELEPIIDRSRHNPACDPNFFFWIRTDDWYWTRRRASWNPSSGAWYLFFSYGSADTDSRGGECFVLAVRPAGVPGQ